MSYAPQHESPLLALPAELRNQIYELTFTSSTVRVGPFYQRKGPSTTSMLRARNPKQTSTRNAGLVLACKQIYKETLLLYYQHTTFLVFNYDCIREWLKVLKPVVIVTVKVVVTEEESPGMVEELASEKLGSNGAFLARGMVRFQINQSR